MVKENRLKVCCIILGVVFVGVGLLDLGILYLLEEELNLSGCEMCFKLNPQIADCENYKPINYSNFTITILDYGK